MSPSGPRHPPGTEELRIVAAVVWNPVIKPVLLGLLSATVAGILQVGKAMYKLLPSTALALVLATPVWAEEPNSGAVGIDEPTVADTGRLLIAQDTESQEVEETPDVMDSQPGVITGEDVDDEDTGAMAPGSTGGPDEKGSGAAASGSDGGDTAEGSGAAGDSGTGGESSGSSGDSSGGSSGGSSD